MVYVRISWVQNSEVLLDANSGAVKPLKYCFYVREVLEFIPKEYHKISKENFSKKVIQQDKPYKFSIMN